MKKIFLLWIAAYGSLYAGNPDHSCSTSAASQMCSGGESSGFKMRIDLGLNNYLEDGEFPEANGALYSVKPWGSWYAFLGIDKVSKTFGPLYFNYGTGVSWYNFKFDSPETRIIRDDNGVVFLPSDRPDEVSVKSKLTAAYIEAFLAPVLYFGRDNYAQRGSFLEFDESSGLRIGFGGYIGYKIDSYSKVVFKDAGDDRDRQRRHSGYFLENFRYGVRAQVGVNALNLFANYDLNELFAAGRGPKLNAFSFGIVL